MSTYHCTSCGRAIFHSHAIQKITRLSAFDGHAAEAYSIREAIDPGTLRRYDVSLHEGWYCCRFIMMRMTRDKFGTGSDLLVYTDAVVEVADGAAPPVAKHRGGQVKLGKRDHDAVIAAADPDELLVIKHGAIWCPPCRHMDAVIDRIVAKGALPRVRFFELDIDEEPELAARFRNGAVPFFVFYRGGKQVPVRGTDGGLVGALRERALIEVCSALLAANAA